MPASLLWSWRYCTTPTYPLLSAMQYPEMPPSSGGGGWGRGYFCRMMAVKSFIQIQGPLFDPSAPPAPRLCKSASGLPVSSRLVSEISEAPLALQSIQYVAFGWRTSINRSINESINHARMPAAVYGYAAELITHNPYSILLISAMKCPAGNTPSRAEWSRGGCTGTHYPDPNPSRVDIIPSPYRPRSYILFSAEGESKCKCVNQRGWRGAKVLKFKFPAQWIMVGR